jgi:hypothetical protein
VERSLEQLSDLLLRFKHFNQFPLPQEIWIQGQTGQVEAFSNAVRHAHQSLVTAPDFDPLDRGAHWGQSGAPAAAEGPARLAHHQTSLPSDGGNQFRLALHPEGGVSVDAFCQ